MAPIYKEYILAEESRMCNYISQSVCFTSDNSKTKNRILKRGIRGKIYNPSRVHNK